MADVLFYVHLTPCTMLADSRCPSAMIFLTKHDVSTATAITEEVSNY
jgi:hypothetical protein